MAWHSYCIWCRISRSFLWCIICICFYACMSDLCYSSISNLSAYLDNTKAIFGIDQSNHLNWSMPRLSIKGPPISSLVSLLKGDMYWFFPGKMLPCISAFHWARLRTWFVMCGGRSSILHYGPLIETNFLYAPTPNGQFKPECVAKQKWYPLPARYQQEDLAQW